MVQEDNNPPEISPEDIVHVDCLDCSGDAYKLITLGKVKLLPVEFALCTDCACLGVYEAEKMIPITPELDEMLMLNYEKEYTTIKTLRSMTKRMLLMSRWMWN